MSTILTAPLHTPALSRQRLLRQTLLCVAIGTAVCLPTVTYAAQPFESGAQQDDVLAGVDKFAQGAKSSSEVTLDKSTMGMATNMLMLQAGKGGEQAAMLGLMGKMDSVLVRNYEYAAPDQYKLEEVEKIRKRLDHGGWTHLVREHSENEATDICVKSNSEGVISEMVVISAEPKELNFIHLRGHMSPNDLSAVSGGFGGPLPDPSIKTRPK